MFLLFLAPDKNCAFIWSFWAHGGREGGEGEACFLLCMSPNVSTG